MKIKGYYFITDTSASRSGNVSDVRNAVRSGVGVVQYRRKNAGVEDLYKEARALRRICKNALFLINDRVDLALSVGADGVHLGQGDISCETARRLLGKGKVIGLTVRSVEQALKAQNSSADYLSAGPIFRTGTKFDAARPVGINTLKKIRKITSLPIVAVGGINLKNAPGVIASGADAIAAISAVVTKKDVKKEIKKFQSLFKNP